MKHCIRLATDNDSNAILNIYRPYVESTAASFEHSPPTLDDFSARIKKIAQTYPFLVFEENHEIIGYAYASRHRERAAYQFDVDTTIYVDENFHGTGVSRKLYSCLFAILKALGLYNAYAAIALPNEKSLRFHKSFGFEPIGTHHKTGYKLGKWHDVLWLEKSIIEPIENPSPAISIGELSADFLSELLNKLSGSE